jgi:hypothetical protein
VDGAYVWLWSPSVGRSGGILCGIKSSRFNVLNLSVGRYFVKVKVHDKQNQKDYWLITVYGAAQIADKDMFLQDLSNICDNLHILALVGGDFNILRFADEKNKGNGTSRFSDSFNDVIDLHNLREIPLSGGQFTWSNNQKNPTLEKLDRILINCEWENLFPLSSARKSQDLCLITIPLFWTLMKNLNQRVESLGLRKAGSNILSFYAEWKELGIV